MLENLVLKEQDQILFREWLELNINNITWEGRYGEEFNSFWDGLFPADSTIPEQVERLDKAILLCHSGPLIAWFQWLKSCFIVHIYINKNLSLLELTQVISIPVGKVSVILRDFFVERFPHLEESLNEAFHISHITCEKINDTFYQLRDDLKLSDEIRGTLDDDVLKNLEVTLYDDWDVLSQKIILRKNELNENIIEIKKATTIKKQIKFIKELALLFLVGGLFIIGVKYGTKWYENNLVQKITLFEPNFFWLDKEITYQSEDPLEEKGIKLSYKELDDLEKLESKEFFLSNEKTKRYEVESDVVLTSVDTLPKDFTAADLEKSVYEENRKGGYRNVKYGGRKAYRIMMTSESPQRTKSRLIKVLKKYEVEQVDNVKPGTEIPGGIYFNILVKRKFLKEFIFKVTSVREARILESKTVFGGPRGTNKVFIWIKQI